MLTLQIQNHGRVTVLRCSGRVVHGDGADTLLRTVKSLDKRPIQIDLGQVETIDASGLGVLAALQKWAEECGREVRLTNLPRRVREAIDTTKLDSVLQVGPAAEEQDDAA